MPSAPICIGELSEPSSYTNAARTAFSDKKRWCLWPIWLVSTTFTRFERCNDKISVAHKNTNLSNVSLMMLM